MTVHFARKTRLSPLATPWSAAPHIRWHSISHVLPESQTCGKSRFCLGHHIFTRSERWASGFLGRLRQAASIMSRPSGQPQPPRACSMSSVLACLSRVAEILPNVWNVSFAAAILAAPMATFGPTRVRWIFRDQSRAHAEHRILFTTVRLRRALPLISFSL